MTTNQLTGTPAKVDAKQVLAGRVLLAAPADDPDGYAHLIATSPTPMSGLVVGGANWREHLRRLRRAHPDLLLTVDPPECGLYFATAADPFPTGIDPDELALMAPPTLKQRLAEQLHNGADVAVLGTGYIQAADAPALKAAVTEVLTLERNDVLVVLNLAYQWLTGRDLRQLQAGLDLIKGYPVAICLGDGDGDPMGRPGVLDGVRAIAASERWVMFHKTDLGGLDAMSHGANAASIGVIASKRRAAIPGAIMRAPRKGRGQNVLRPELLRYMRSFDMQDKLYQRLKAPGCPCPECLEAAIDRFDNTKEAKASCSRHNAYGILGLIDDADVAGGWATYWPAKVSAAVVEHQTLAGKVGIKFPAPRGVRAWLDRPTNTGTSTGTDVPPRSKQNNGRPRPTRS